MRWNLTLVEAAELREELDEMRRELSELAFPPIRPVGDIADVLANRLERRRSLERWVQRGERILEEARRP